MDSGQQKRALELSGRIARKMGVLAGEDISDLVALCEMAVLVNDGLGIEHRAYTSVKGDNGGTDNYVAGPVGTLQDAWERASRLLKNIH